MAKLKAKSMWKAMKNRSDIESPIKQVEPVRSKDLFMLIKEGKVSTESLVDDWLNLCKNDETSALHQLLRLCFSSAGSPIDAAQPENILEVDMIDLLDKCAEQGFAKLDEENFEEYPLSRKNTKSLWKNFRSNLSGFIRVLFDMGQHTFLYKGTLIDKLIELIFGMISSVDGKYYKCFFHTGIFFGLKMNTVVVEVHRKLKDDLKRIHNQDKPDEQTLDEIDEKINYVSKLKEKLCKLVPIGYLHEINDVQCLTMEELGCWLFIDPEEFLVDLNLRYFHRVLHDVDSPNARSQAIVSLVPIYSLIEENPDILERLKGFTSRVFHKIFCQACISPDVAMMSAAHKIISHLHFYKEPHDYIVTEEELTDIFLPNLTGHREAAMNSAKYLIERLTSENDSRVKVALAFINLLKRGNLKRCDQFISLITDSLNSVSDIFKDLELLYNILISNEQSSDVELYLCHFFYASYELQTTLVRLPPRIVKMTKKDLQAKNAQKEDLAECFVPRIFNLLTTFSHDIEKCQLIVRLIRLLDKAMFVRLNAEVSLSNIMKELTKLFDNHSSINFLEEMSKTMVYLMQDDYLLNHVAKNLGGMFFDSLIAELEHSLKLYLEDRLSPERVNLLWIPMRKLRMILKYHDLSSYDEFFRDLPKVLTFTTLKNSEAFYAETLVAIVYFVQRQVLKSHVEDLPYLENLQMKTLMSALKITGVNKETEDAAFECIIFFMTSFKKELKNLECYKLLFRDNNSFILSCNTVAGIASSKLESFVVKRVFNDDSETNLEGKLRILQAYLQVVMSRRIPMQAGHFLFLYWNKFIVLQTLIKQFFYWCRNTSRSAFLKTVLYSLAMIFESKKLKLKELKQLSKELALQFGSRSEANRESMFILHKDGIVFSVRYKSGDNLEFLKVLCEWSFKVARRDRDKILRFFDNQLKELRGQEFSKDTRRDINFYRATLGSQESKVLKHLINAKEPTLQKPPALSWKKLRNNPQRSPRKSTSNSEESDDATPVVQKITPEEVTTLEKKEQNEDLANQSDNEKAQKELNIKTEETSDNERVETEEEEYNSDDCRIVSEYASEESVAEVESFQYNTTETSFQNSTIPEDLIIIEDSSDDEESSDEHQQRTKSLGSPSEASDENNNKSRDSDIWNSSSEDIYPDHAAQIAKRIYNRTSSQSSSIESIEGKKLIYPK
ncbi:DgyrCDS6624 [Dimorphilus gyrociliatus]|uniref:DgyrCDS6624 n=1 Tax=Dimorphilus gyrociliatus TaxID=2664684 RepID=A0A7I8VNK6_9ANNE|nr:DgyrCDS6624 [Dimorphilus gyrociliatus]